MRSHEKTRRVHFHVRAPSDQAVYVAGTFNGWSSRQDRMWQGPFNEGVHKKHLSLRPGRYEYKFVSGIDWFADPDNPDTVDNGFGSVNSVLKVY